MTTDANHTPQPAQEPAPGQFMPPGHGAGDILQAHAWKIVEQRPGLLTVDVHLPESLKNPQGQLFGG